MFTIALQCWGLVLDAGLANARLLAARLVANRWIAHQWLVGQGHLSEKLTMGLVSFDTDTNRFIRRNELERR